jgi:putative hydrolase of the HAD superfamily
LCYPQYSQKIKWLLDHYHEDQPLIPGMLGLVKTLKSKPFRLFLLSNAGIRFYEYEKDLEVLKYLDGITISADIHMLKPHPEIYITFCQIHALKPEECLLIDDKQENVEGAKACGWHAHRFTNPAALLNHLKSLKIL